MISQVHSPPVLKESQCHPRSRPILTSPSSASTVQRTRGAQAAAPQPPQAHAAADGGAQQASPLGPLAGLVGSWKGHGFNAIWRPHHSGQDRFLELNRTDETFVVTEINGPIPNRGLANPDINMFGVTYLQQINEAGTPNGLHIEPGIWASVPHTTDPNIPPSVVRMASIPHGTVILAQGNAQILQGGPPHIPNNNIFPNFFNTAAVHGPCVRGRLVPGARSVNPDVVPVRVAGRHAGHGHEPQQRSPAGADRSRSRART